MTLVPRYDFGALWEAAQVPTFLELSRRVGVSARQLYRWAHYGVPDDRADQLAIALGHVPYAIWPEWLQGSGTEVRDWVQTTGAERERRRQEEQERRRVAIEVIREAEKPKRRTPGMDSRLCPQCQWSFVPKTHTQRFCRTRCAEESPTRTQPLGASDTQVGGVTI